MGSQSPSEWQPLLLRVGPAGDSGRSSGQVSVFGKDSQRRDNGRWYATMLLLNYMIGSGILNQAQVFSSSGIAAAAVLYILSGVAIYWGLLLLIQAGERVSLMKLAESLGPEDDEPGYAELGMQVYGPRGAHAVDLSIMVANFGSCLSYAIVVGVLVQSLLAEWTGASESTFSLFAVIPALWTLLVLPLCLIRHFSNLRFFAIMSLTAVLIAWLMVVIGGPIYAEEQGIFDDDSTVDTSLVWWSWLGMGTKSGSVVFALSSAAVAFHTYGSMYPREERLWQTVSGWAVGVGCVMCASIGLAGYLSFRSSTEADILDNFDGLVASVVKFIIACHLILYIPNEIVVLRHSLISLFGGDVMKMDACPVFLVTAGVLGSIAGLVLGLVAWGVAEGDIFGYCLDLTGGVAGGFISFIFPAFFYLRVTERDAQQERARAVTGTVGGGGGGGGDDRKSSVLRMRLYAKVLGAFGIAVLILVPVSIALEESL